MHAAVKGYTAWSNMRLVREGCEAKDILLDIVLGNRMKVILERKLAMLSYNIIFMTQWHLFFFGKAAYVVLPLVLP